MKRETEEQSEIERELGERERETEINTEKERMREIVRHDDKEREGGWVKVERER